MRTLARVVTLAIILGAVVPSVHAGCQVYPITLQGRVAGYDFERSGLLRRLDWSLSGDEVLRFEFSIWSPASTGRQNGDLVLTTHSKLFQTKDPVRTAAIRPLDNGEFEVLPYNNELNFFVHGSVAVKVRKGSMTFRIVRSPRGVVNGKIHFIGTLPNNEESEYFATFHGSDPSDDGTDIPCVRPFK